MHSNFLAELLGKGPLQSVLIWVALVLMVVAVGIWIMEFSGWTISTKGFVKNRVKWDATNIALIAVCAALFTAGRPLAINFIPGIGGLNPSLSISQTLSILFGLPGVIGVTFSMPIGDAISGQLTLGSVAGLLGNTYTAWITYKICTGANFKVFRNVLTFYVGGVILAPIIEAIVIPGWLDFIHLVPPAVAWGGVTLSILTNQGLLPAIVTPILVPILYPIVKARGLYWRDRLSTPLAVPMELTSA
jgi:energy-coupling factor transport system substrate-specific component